MLAIESTLQHLGNLKHTLNANFSDTVDGWGTIDTDLAQVHKLALSANELCFEIRRGQTLWIGRENSTANRAPADGMMSRNHFSIECIANGAILCDLGSRNGTFVNGAYARFFRLRDGDQVTAGRPHFTVRLFCD